MRALLTGATGFIGSHVARLLSEKGVEVTALVRPSSDREALSGIRLKVLLGSVTDAAVLERAVRGMDYVFHIAADYRFWVPDAQNMCATNVEGTRLVLEAACQAGVGRIVYTSSAVTVRCPHDRLGTEQDFLQPEEARSTYQRTKILAEQVAWRFIESRAPITIVNPSTPIGSGDRRPTPTGQLLIDFLAGRLPAYLEATFNWIAVTDVAAGHWLAATEGRVGERYILGHQNLSLGAFLSLLGEVSGRRPPRIQIPYAVAWCAGACGELVGRLTGGVPRASLEGVSMARQPMRYDSAKAVKDLGLPQTSLRDALHEAVCYFRAQRTLNQGRAS